MPHTPLRKNSSAKSAQKRAPPRARTGAGSADADVSKSEATRQRILDAAALVMSREGFAGTKLSEIAHEAGIKIATLYYYYPSREDLVQAVLVSGTQHVREHTEQAVAGLDPACPPLDRLCTAVEAHLRYILEISHYTEAAVRNSSQVPARVQQAIQEEQAKYGRLWQQLVDAAAIGTRHATPAERKAVRMLIIGAMNWTIEWWTPRQMPIDDLVAATLSLTRGAFAPSPAKSRPPR